MPRRRTTIGSGAFGRRIDTTEHLTQTYRRIRSRRLPLTEDAVFVLTLFMLSQRNESKHVLKAVRTSKDIGGYRYFGFSPDIDLLEVRRDSSVVAYELKGVQGAQKSVTYYEGLGQALSYLVNPVSSPLSHTAPSTASVFDYVYLVHPDQEYADTVVRDAFVKLVHNFTPVGLIYLDHDRWKEIVPAKPNPFLNKDLQALFLQHLGAFETYREIRLNLVQ